MESDLTQIFFGLLALIVGGVIGWLLGGRGAATLKAERDAVRAERDAHLANFKQAACDSR